MAEEKIKKVKEKKVKEVKIKKEKPARQKAEPLVNSSKSQIKEKTEKKNIFKKKEKIAKVPEQNIENKRPHVSKRQRGYDDKKSKLAVKGRQTKWAPVWVVMKKYGTGKRIHPSATTAVKRSWRRTKLHIKPRRIRKSHMG